MMGRHPEERDSGGLVDARPERLAVELRTDVPDGGTKRRRHGVEVRIRSVGVAEAEESRVVHLKPDPGPVE